MKVLIIDDEEHVRDAITYIVDWDRFGISERFTASSVMEAEQIINQQRPHVIFCDIKMPEHSGLDIIEWVRQKGWNIQVIVISGYDDFEYMRAVIQAKAIDYLLKPIRKHEIEKALETAINSWRENEKAEEWRDIMALTDEDQSEDHNVIKSIKKYLDQHFQEKITLEELGKRFYLTPQYISGKYKEVYGISVIEYVTMLKIKKAKILLIESPKTISSISYELGFSNENYFSKVFKKYEGNSPKKFREMAELN